MAARGGKRYAGLLVVLALALLAQLPARALLLADRLHGCAAFLAAAGRPNAGPRWPLNAARSRRSEELACRRTTGGAIFAVAARRAGRLRCHAVLRRAAGDRPGGAQRAKPSGLKRKSAFSSAANPSAIVTK